MLTHTAFIIKTNYRVRVPLKQEVNWQSSCPQENGISKIIEEANFYTMKDAEMYIIFTINRVEVGLNFST